MYKESTAHKLYEPLQVTDIFPSCSYRRVNLKSNRIVYYCQTKSRVTCFTFLQDNTVLHHKYLHKKVTQKYLDTEVNTWLAGGEMI